MGFDYSFINVGGRPLRMRVTSYGIVVVDSIDGKVFLISDGKEIATVENLSFPVWADVCCGGIYISDIKRSEVILWKDGRVVKRLKVARPEMLFSKDEKIFVSSGNVVLMLDKDLNILRKFVFPSSSVYFYVQDGKIIHLEYWGDHPDVTIASLSGNYRMSMNFGLSKPFRYLEVDGEIFILDYFGKLAVLNGGSRKILKVGRYSYGMTYDSKNLYISSLVEKFLRVIDLKNLHQKILPIPSPAAALEKCCGYLVVCGIFKDEVYVMKGKDIQTIKGCGYPIAVESDPPFVYVLCSDSGKILKIDFSR